jgi:hypothetical protein
VAADPDLAANEGGLAAPRRRRGRCLHLPSPRLGDAEDPR